jgi:murein DD-endopeptidase MepM/ murein hydrolase activator NlpD
MPKESQTRLGPFTVAILGLAAIAVGLSIKTGFIKIGRDAAAADSSVSVKTGAGDVTLPDSVARKATTTAAPPTPTALTADTLGPPAAVEDSNAVQPTPDELARLSSELIIPVAGVQSKDLLDTFAEARGVRRHNALDILAPRSTPVLSAADGRIQKLYTSQAGGLMVYASDPANRFVLMYAHLDRYADGLRDSAEVRRGDTIGFVGTTGNAPPDVPHLHFAIARTTNVARWWTGMPVDPRPLLRR